MKIEDIREIDWDLQYEGRGIIDMANSYPVYVFKYRSLTYESLEEILNNLNLKQ